VSLLEVSDDGNIQQKALQEMEQEVACLSIDAISEGVGSLVAAVGLWNTYSVVLLEIPTLETIEVINIGTTFLLRSVLTVALSNDHAYLFVGLGDGSLVSYSYTQGQSSIDKSTKKTASLGTRPITLVKFHTSGNAEAGIPSRPAVLAISDRSTVVSTEGKKLTFASVNMRVSNPFPDVFIAC
jgi:DNA damage-binding protein 1